MRSRSFHLPGHIGVMLLLLIIYVVIKIFQHKSLHLQKNGLTLQHKHFHYHNSMKKLNIHRLLAPTLMLSVLAACSSEKEDAPNNINNNEPEQTESATWEVIIEDEQGFNLLNTLEGRPSLLDHKLRFNGYMDPLDTDYAYVEVDGYNEAMKSEGCRAYLLWPDDTRYLDNPYFCPDRLNRETVECKYHTGVQHPVYYVITGDDSSMLGPGFSLVWEEGNKTWYFQARKVDNENPGLVDIYVNASKVMRVNWQEEIPRIKLVVNSDEMPDTEIL